MMTRLFVWVAALIDFKILWCSRTIYMQSESNIMSNCLPGSAPKMRPSAFKSTSFTSALCKMLFIISSSGKSVASTCAPYLAAMMDGSAAPAPSSRTVLPNTSHRWINSARAMDALKRTCAQSECSGINRMSHPRACVSVYSASLLLSVKFINIYKYVIK